jgi:ACR3 family arsenite efflux pump ArsB
VLANPETFFAPMTVGTTNLPIAIGLILVGIAHCIAMVLV